MKKIFKIITLIAAPILVIGSVFTIIRKFKKKKVFNPYGQYEF